MLTADPDPWHTHPLNLHTIVFGGEALETHHIPSWFHHLTDAALTNMYGITETTVHATAAPVHPHQQPTLGHPIANTGLHLLDHHLTPVPDGTIGEIHLTGAGLARGYLNQPALTAERFIPNPFGPGRLYRTGDLARYRNGDLEYIGRRDRQIKLRGYRIEGSPRSNTPSATPTSPSTTANSPPTPAPPTTPTTSAPCSPTT